MAPLRGQQEPGGRAVLSQGAREPPGRLFSLTRTVGMVCLVVLYIIIIVKQRLKQTIIHKQEQYHHT